MGCKKKGGLTTPGVSSSRWIFRRKGSAREGQVTSCLRLTCSARVPRTLAFSYLVMYLVVIRTLGAWWPSSCLRDEESGLKGGGGNVLRKQEQKLHALDLPQPMLCLKECIVRRNDPLSSYFPPLKEAHFSMTSTFSPPSWSSPNCCSSSITSSASSKSSKSSAPLRSCSVEVGVDSGHAGKEKGQRRGTTFERREGRKNMCGWSSRFQGFEDTTTHSVH